jgi:HEAT repeat protein
MVLKAHLLGEARARWGDTAYWVQALAAAGVFVQDRPLSMGEQEINFSLIATPENLRDLLREYGLMADYSLDARNFEQTLDSLYTRYQSQPEIQQKLMGYFLSNLNRGAMPFYERYMADGQNLQLIIERATIGIYHNDEMVRYTSLLIWQSLFHRGEGVDAAEQIVEKGLSDPNPDIRNAAYALLENLIVRANRGYPIAIDAASIGIYDKDESVRITSLRIWKALFRRSQCFDPAEQALKEGLTDPDPAIRHTAYSLLSQLVNESQGYPTAIDAAAIGIYDNDDIIRNTSLQIWRALFERSQGFDAAEEAIKKGLNDTNPLIRKEVYVLLHRLVEESHSYRTAIDAAAIGIYDDDPDVRDTSMQIWQSLFKYSQGFDAAEEAIKKGLSDTNPMIRNAAFTLLYRRVLRNHSYPSYPIAIEAAAIGIYDNDQSVRNTSLQIWESLFNYSQGFDSAEDAIKKGLRDPTLLIRGAAYDLLHRLVVRYRSYPTAIDTAAIGIYDNDDIIRYASLQIWESLFERSQGFHTAEEAIKKGLGSTNPMIRRAAHELSNIYTRFSPGS